MNYIELSEYIRNSHPSSKMSSSRRKLSFGGVINDADYTVSPKISGVKVRCPAYTSWKNILIRVFSESYQHKQPTYKGCTICDEWLSFMSYRAWWVKNYQQDFHLDKDFIKPGNKEYSPEHCIFIPQWINAIVSGHDAKRGDSPIGVTFDKRYNLFIARVGSGKTGEKKYIGSFNTQQDAALAYKKEKLNLIHDLKHEIDMIDTRLYSGIVACIKSKTNPL